MPLLSHTAASSCCSAPVPLWLPLIVEAEVWRPRVLCFYLYPHSCAATSPRYCVFTLLRYCVAAYLCRYISAPLYPLNYIHMPPHLCPHTLNVGSCPHVVTSLYLYLLPPRALVTWISMPVPPRCPQSLVLNCVPDPSHANVPNTLDPTFYYVLCYSMSPVTCAPVSFLLAKRGKNRRGKEEKKVKEPGGGRKKQSKNSKKTHPFD